MPAPVLVEESDGVLVMTINRPEVRNAVNLAVSRALAEAMVELDARPHLRVGLITGAGGTFCAGMDLKAFARGERPYVDGRGFAGFVEAPPKKPLVAAVEGYAVGGGLEVLLACDVVVAAEDVRLGLPEVRRGLAAGSGGLLRLPRQVPHKVALELALTGELITARRAFEIGLVNRVVATGAALAAAHELAAVIAANAPLGVAASKQIITESHDWPLGELFSRQSPIIEVIRNSRDALEGATAFAEKRPPDWRGE